MSQTNKVRLGIIGMGNMGSSHLRFYLEDELPEITVTAVADIDPERLEWAKEECPEILTYDSADTLINSGEVDAVIIATPHYFHPEMAIKALKAGIHVMCEKPAGVYTKQVKEMNEVAKNSNALFAIMFNQRTNCLYRKAHELVHSGEFGELKRVNWIITDWFRTQRYYDSGGWRATWSGEGGGVLLNQCPHNLDLWQWICGMPVKIFAVCHEGKWHDIEVEDDVMIYAEYENGATGTFVTTTGDFPGTNRLEITLDRAKLICENGTLTVNELEKNTIEFTKTSSQGFGSIKYKTYEAELDGENPQHSGVLNAFAAAVLRGEPLVAKGEEGINGLTISNAAFLSSWLGKAVDIPFDDELFYSELQKKIESSSIKKNVVSSVQEDMSLTY